jgi:hypothetical protein
MDQSLICELNLALIPDIDLASRHITFSRHMAGRYRSLIQLDGGSVTPSGASYFCSLSRVIVVMTAPIRRFSGITCG